jgi:hypothetical protein
MEFMFLVFIGMPATAIGRRDALSLPELGMWISRMNWHLGKMDKRSPTIGFAKVGCKEENAERLPH